MHVHISNKILEREPAKCVKRNVRDYNFINKFNYTVLETVMGSRINTPMKYSTTLCLKYNS